MMARNQSGAFALPMRSVAVAVALAIAAMALFLPARQADAQTATSGLPVSGELADGGNFEGTVSDLEASVNDAGDLVVSGVLNGTATDAAGDTTQITDQAFTTTAALDQGASCDILFLDLGPIFLDLLGLELDLSQITLDVNAVPGAGNLLGNLLCAITGLLDNPGNPTNAIANLLDRVLGLLG